MIKKTLIAICIVLYLVWTMWTIDFMVLTLLDLQILLSILLGTLVFYILTDTKQLTLLRKLNLIKWYSQIAAVVLTLFLEMEVTSKPINAETLEIIIKNLRPLFYGALIFMVLQAFIHAKKEPPNQMNLDLTNSLTKRELEVFQLLIDHKTNQEIANKLYISESTVKKHVQNILAKTDTSNREELKLKAKI